MDYAISHGVLDGILTIVLALIGWFLTGLRSELRKFNEQQEKHTDALNSLAIMVGRDYVTRSEHSQDLRELREAVEKTADNAREDLARLHARMDSLKAKT